MAEIDYEVEYDNRARVPEHAEIFLRWAGEAENYRADMLKAGRAELGLSYGDTPRQTVDLFLPQAAERAPLAMFVHGGWWRSLEPSSFSQMARGLNARGVTVAVAGYDLCPIVTIADIVNQIRRACAFLWQRQAKRMLVYGHSAGGHLALWAASRSRLPAGAPGAGPGVALAAAISAAGVNDLAQTWREAPGGAVERLMGGGPDELPERYALADPVALVPLAVPVLLVHGTEDQIVSVRRSRNYAAAAAARGASVELVEIAGAAGRHRSHVFPSSASFAAVLRWLAAAG